MPERSGWKPQVLMIVGGTSVRREKGMAQLEEFIVLVDMKTFS